MNVLLSQGRDDFFIQSTIPGTTRVFGGNEAPVQNEDDDEIDINSIAGPTEIFLGDGNDIVRVNHDDNGGQTEDAFYQHLI